MEQPKPDKKAEDKPRAFLGVKCKGTGYAPQPGDPPQPPKKESNSVPNS